MDINCSSLPERVNNNFLAIQTLIPTSNRANHVIVIAGSLDIVKLDPSVQVRRVSANDIEIHPYFDSLSLVNMINDIALIRLSSSLVFTRNVGPIRLPSRGSLTNNLEGEKGVISGWGYIGNSDSRISSKLQFVYMDVESYESCVEYHDISDGNICANSAGGTKTACYGDSGGPFVINKRLVGIYSYGPVFGCETDGPEVFTRVAYYLDWIQNVTGLNT